MKPIEERAKEVAGDLRRECGEGNPENWSLEWYRRWLNGLADLLDPPPPKKMRLWVHPRPGDNVAGVQADAIIGPCAPDKGYVEFVPRSEVERLRGAINGAKAMLLRATSPIPDDQLAGVYEATKILDAALKEDGDAE